MRIALVSLLSVLAATGAAAATDKFVGPHIGAAIGAVDHHFVLEVEDQAGNDRRFNVTRWGLGGEAFAGYDTSISTNLLAGLEGAVQFGGKTAVERNSDYTIGIKPHWGFSLTGRLGYTLSDNVMAYAGGGYGQHRYGAFSSQPGAVDNLRRNSSFVLRGGMEVAATPHVHARLEFQHLDGTRNQFMIGIPIRF